MTDTVAPASPSPAMMSSTSKNEKKSDSDRPDPDRLLMDAKRLVVDNYNEHREAARSSPLTMDSVYIVWFAKTLGNWKAIVASPVTRGLLWEVAFNGHRKEAYIDIYKKLNSVKVLVEGNT